MKTRMVAIGIIGLLVVSSIMGFVNFVGASAIEITNKEVRTATLEKEISDNSMLAPKDPRYTTHDPITINGNSNFTSANGVTSGDGTAGNPYIIEGWDINASSENGIEIKSTDKYFVIRNVYVHGSSWSYWNNGIDFFRVRNGRVENCEIKNTGSGISLGMYSSNNNINGNNISNNENGIILTSDSNENINSNNISNNGYGIELGDSLDNKIIGNTVYDNGYGIYLKTYLSASANNIIYQNNFINGTYEQAYDDSNNKWDYNNKGNYWSDYNGTDANGDGIGDTPYSILGGNNKDNYPLMKKVEKVDVIVDKPEDKKEEAKKGFIPGFEVAALLGAIGICTLLITVKRKKKGDDR